MPATKDDLLRCLIDNGHVGHERGITARHLAGRLDVPERRVRELVTEAREDGIALCGHPRTGYFVALNADEIARYYVDFLIARAKHSLWLAHRASKRPLQELAGQLLIVEDGR